ncbi:MAG: alpha/beta fold hydrolase [Cyclobacteriaceae bacterium]
MREEQFKLQTEDGVSLDALHVRGEEVKAALQINAATGTKKEFYLNFARYLAAQGYAVVLFDYRGIGSSAPGHLRGYQADLKDWGGKDMATAFAWLKEQYPELPRYILGHSMGGQLIGLMHNATEAEGIILAGSLWGYWPLLPFPSNVFYFFIWYLLQPLMTRIFGYLPASWLGIGEDVPAGVANEFRQWCTSPGYLSAYFGRSIRKQFYEQIKVPLLSIVPTDDNIAGRRSVPPLLRLYRYARIEEMWLRPAEFGNKTIGHFGLFSRRFKNNIWPLFVDFLERCQQEKVVRR